MAGDLSGAIEAVRASLDAVASVDVAAVTEQELADAVVEVGALRARVQAAEARLLGAFDGRGACEADGARSTSSWLAWRRRESKRAARACVALARALRDLPDAVAEALGAGTVTDEHVFELRRAQRAAPAHFADGGGAHLLQLATEVAFASFKAAVQYWIQRADPDGVEDAPADEHAQRRCHASRTWRDTVQVDALLDRLGGEVFLNELMRLEQQLFEADWAEARARLGGAATKNDLARTAAQRRADALVLMAERSAAMPPDARVARPLLTVLVDYETFAGRVCELASGVVLTPGQVASLLTTADIERVVFGSPSRVLDVGAKRRLFEGATRRAVEVRDRTCRHPGCDVPAARCEVDHVVDFDGANTVQANGQCLCPWHHDRKTRRRHGPPPRPPNAPRRE